MRRVLIRTEALFGPDTIYGVISGKDGDGLWGKPKKTPFFDAMRAPAHHPARRIDIKRTEIGVACAWPVVPINALLEVPVKSMCFLGPIKRLYTSRLSHVIPG
jgi:hypothetical protein